MISIKCRVLIKTVQLYSISNMTIKITGGPKWIVHCASSLAGKHRIPHSKDIKVSPLKIQMCRKYFGGGGDPRASINHVSVFFCPCFTSVKWKSTNYVIKIINNEQKWNIHVSAS